ncbi:MAG: sigma-70 family RNA polymerase sigma factor [Gemmataceae bacterium]|nr:sigma-70 family RNA polymerase sigma factor [Gemmataceae bacterium]
MPHRPLAAVFELIRPLLRPGDSAERSDRELLDSFVARQDEAAFAVLVRRHGPMVLGVCRRLLGDAHAAEDAFQATFLVLVRRAGSVPWREVIGSWLYQVAYRTAMKARVAATQRQAREREAGKMRAMLPEGATTECDLQTVLDSELQRLPAKYRMPVVLCCVQGRSKIEAARELGWKEGTVASRLARARDLLRQRLTRRGVTLAAAAAALAPQALTAAVSTGLETTTLQAAAASMRGSGLASAAVTSLVQGVLRDLALARVRCAAVIVLMLAALGGSAGALVVHLRGGEPPAPEATANVDNPTPERFDRKDAFGDPLPDGALFRIGTGRLRHGQTITQVAFAPHEKLLVSSGADATLRVWEVGTGKEVRRLAHGAYGVNSSSYTNFAIAPDGLTLAGNRADKLHLYETATGKLKLQLDAGYADHLDFTPDSKQLIAVYKERVVHWDVATGKNLHEWKIEKETHARCFFTRDRTTLVTANFAEPHVVRVWDVAGGKMLREWDAHAGQKQGEPHETYIRSAGLSPDEKLLVTASDNHMIRIWDFATGKEKAHWKSSAAPFAVAFAPDGRSLVVAVSGHEVLFCDPSTGKTLRRLSDAWSPLAFSADGRTMASAGRGDYLRFWDLESGKEIDPLPARPGRVDSVAFSPDSSVLASRCAGHHWLWQTGSGKFVARLPDCRELVYSPDGKVQAQFRVDRAGTTHQGAGPITTVRLMSVANGAEIARFHVEGEGESPVAWSADGRTLATHSGWRGDKEPTVLQLWDTTTGKELRRFTGRSVVCSPDAKTVVIVTRTWGSVISQNLAMGDSGKGGGDAFVLDAVTGKERGRLKGYTFAVAVATTMGGQEVGHGVMNFDPVFSPDGRYLATAIGDGSKFALWDVATIEPLVQLSGKEYEPGPLAFSPDSRFLALRDSEGALTLLHTTTGKVYRKLDHDQERDLEAVVFSPDSRLLASAHKDCTVRLWEIATGREVRQFVGPQTPRGLLFAPDGKSVVSVNSDTTALVWDVTGRAREKRPARPNLEPHDLEKGWAELSADDASAAQTAVWRLAEVPAKAVPFIAERVKPTAAPDRQRLARAIADLESNQFALRQKAADELSALGELAVADLRTVLNRGPALDLRQRVQQLLDKAEDPAGTAERLRTTRAIQVLEHAGTLEARQTLQKLAAGVAEARLTQDARAVAT